MQRFGQVFRLKEGAEADYEYHHANVWPEVIDAFHKAGMCNASVFRYHRWLFMYFELPDDISPDTVDAVISESDACRRWDELMLNYFEPLPEPDNNTWWAQMKEVWHLPEA